MRWESVTGTPNVLAGTNIVFTAPMVADPGTKLEYGINTDWLGKVIETASDTALDVAVKEAVTGPLGMGQTAFSMNDDQRSGSVPVHLKGADGAWAGLLNTHFWVDPTSGITGAIYTQFLPFVPPAALQMYADFEQALYASL